MDDALEQEEKNRAEAAAVMSAFSGGLADTGELSTTKHREAGVEGTRQEIERSIVDSSPRISPEVRQEDAANFVASGGKLQPIGLLVSSPGKVAPEAEEDDDEENVEAMSTEVKVSKGEDSVDSDATDDEQERVQEDEKAQTEVAAVGGEFGDTTEEEDAEGVDHAKNNIAAEAIRRKDVLHARAGYASQLEEGYEPEDTHTGMFVFAMDPPKSGYRRHSCLYP